MSVSEIECPTSVPTQVNRVWFERALRVPPSHKESDTHSGFLSYIFILSTRYIPVCGLFGAYHRRFVQLVPQFIYSITPDEHT